MKDLDECRMEINNIDSQITRLLEQRCAVAESVAAYKLANGIPVLDSSREAKVIERVRANVVNPSYRGYISNIYDAVMANSRELQTKRMAVIWLIGMPGCGKTTVGRRLATVMGRSFIDADDFFTETNGVSPENVITGEGESSFRDAETRIIRELSERRGYVIALGGGAVTRPENRLSIMDGDVVIYLRRDPDKLISDGRPLSLERGVAALYAERHALYEEWSDLEVDNSDIDVAASECMERLRALGY